jgi:hypothetical protein
VDDRHRWRIITRRLVLFSWHCLVCPFILHLLVLPILFSTKSVANSTKSSWAIVYDTIYACQDRDDDVHAGVKSTALLFGSYVRPILACFATAFIVLLVFAGAANGQRAGYFVISCGGAAAHFVWQFTTWTVDVPADGGAKFNVSPFPLQALWRQIDADDAMQTVERSHRPDHLERYAC